MYLSIWLSTDFPTSFSISSAYRTDSACWGLFHALFARSRWSSVLTYGVFLGSVKRVSWSGWATPFPPKASPKGKGGWETAPSSPHFEECLVVPRTFPKNFSLRIQVPPPGSAKSRRIQRVPVSLLCLLSPGQSRRIQNTRAPQNRWQAPVSWRLPPSSLAIFPEPFPNFWTRLCAVFLASSKWSWAAGGGGVASQRQTEGYVLRKASSQDSAKFPHAF